MESVLRMIDDMDDLEITRVTSKPTSNKSAFSSQEKELKLTPISTQSNSILSRLNTKHPIASLDGLRTSIQKLEKDIAAISFERRRLDTGWDERMLLDNQYYPHVRKLAENKAQLAAQLWNETVTLRNMAIDQGLALPLSFEHDGALYFQRLNLYKDLVPSGKSHNTVVKGQMLGQMRKEAVQAYSADGPVKKVPGHMKQNGETVIVPIKQLWCPVYRDWCGEDEIVVAHIVPSILSIAQMDYYFGAGFGSRKYSSDNSILVPQEIEELMAAGIIVFVPAKSVPKASEIFTDWKVKVLRKKVVGRNRLVSNPDMTLELLEGRNLYWKNDNRPSTRFLYFHYLISHLKNKEAAHKGFAEDWEEMLKSSPFKGLGPFWSRRHLEAVVEYVGHVRDEDVERIAQGTTFNRTVEQLHTNEANEFARRLL